MEDTWRGRGFIASLIALVVIALIAVGLKVGIDAAMTDDNNPTPELEDLTVRPGDILPEQAVCDSDEFIENSLPTSDLKWSDSVSTPFASSDTEEMFDEVLTENCGNPTVLLMNVEALSSIGIDGTTIGDVNPWMSEFVSAFKDDPFSFLTKKAGDEDELFVTPEFQEVAALTNTVLLRLKLVEATVTEQSVTNWHVAAREGLAAGTIPIATLNEDQYKGDFLRLEYTLKGQDCPAFAIGFNVGDKRFATLHPNCEVDVTPPPTSTSTPPTSEEPECPPDMPNGTWPDCKDEPENTPSTPHGGGGPAPDQSDPEGPPAGGEPPAQYTPAPVPPAASSPPTGSTPDPAPAPSPEPSAATPEDEAVGCSPAPGKSCP